MGDINTIEQLLDCDNKINNKNHRFIYGHMVGKNCVYKNASEAFVEHLYLMDTKIKRQNSVSVKKKLYNQRNNFLKNYKNELREDESAMDMLQLALDYCLVKADELGKVIDKKEKEMAKILECNYVDRIDRQEYQKYANIFSTIETLIEQEKHIQEDQVQ